MPIPKSLYYIVGRFFIVIGQLVMIRVLTSILNPLEIGKYYLLMSIVFFPSLFFISPALIFISRHYYDWYRNGFGWAIFKKISLGIFMVSSVCALILTVMRLFNLQQNQLEELYFYIPLLITIGTISSYSQELLNIIGRSRTFILLNNLELWGKIGIITASFFLFPSIAMTVFGAISIWGVVFSLLCIYLLRTYTIDIQVDIEKKKSSVQPFKIRDIFNFSWPITVAASLYWCQTDGYRFVLAYVSDLAYVGKFVVGFGLGAALMSALDILFHQLYLPRYYREISVGTIHSYTEAWNKYAQKVIGIFIPFSLYITCAAPYLTRWLLDSNYWDVGAYAAMGAISQLFRIFSAAFVNGVIAAKRTSALILPSLVGAVIALAGTFMFATKSPLLGTGSSMILAHLAVSIALYFELSRQLPIQLPISAVVKALKVSAPICIVLLLLLKFGFSDVPVLNILTLLVTGSGLLYTQWIMSRDVWFTK